MISYLYRAIKTFFNTNSLYNLPFNHNNIKNDYEFEEFKKNDIELNKIIFALNNIPDIVHSLIFREPSVCVKYYFITLKLNPSKIIDVFHNLDDINDNFIDENVQYIYIRINIISKSLNNTNMHHVNCIVIDKLKKYVLFFEPRLTFMFDTDVLISLVDTFMDLSLYNKIFPPDIGYNMFNKLQRYDTYCQTYVIFIFALIIYNQHVSYKDYYNLFNKSITTTNIGYFLFHIYKTLKECNYDICIQPLIWNYPGHNVTSIFKILNLYLNQNNDTNDTELNNITIDDQSDDSDYMIVSVI